MSPISMHSHLKPTETKNVTKIKGTLYRNNKGNQQNSCGFLKKHKSSALLPRIKVKGLVVQDYNLKSSSEFSNKNVNTVYSKVMRPTNHYPQVHED